MIDLKIEKRKVPWFPTALCCFFYYEDRGYYADLAYVTDRKCNEMMVFPANVIQKKVLDWGDLYKEDFPKISVENLVEWIDHFITKVLKNAKEENC